MYFLTETPHIILSWSVHQWGDNCCLIIFFLAFIQKQYVTIIGASWYLLNDASRSLGVGMTDICQNLLLKEVILVFFSISRNSWCSPRVIYNISGEPTWPKKQEYIYFRGGYLNRFQPNQILSVLGGLDYPGAYNLHTIWFPLTQA